MYTHYGKSNIKQNTVIQIIKVKQSAILDDQVRSCRSKTKEKMIY